MAKTDEDVLEFSVAVDIRNSLKEMTKFQNQMARLMKEISQGSERTSKEQTKRNKQTKKETTGVTDSVKGLSGAYKEKRKQLTNLARVITDLEKRVEGLQGTERTAAEESLAALKKEHDERLKIADAEEKQQKKQKVRKPPDYSFSKKNLKKFKTEFKALGEALKEPLQAFLQRDLKGLIDGSMKGAGATLSRSLKLSKFLAGAGAEALSKRGEQTSVRGKAMGGRKGAMLEAGGAGMKRMGAMMGQIGGVMGTLSKLGPLLGMASGAMMSLVKLFLDADAAVKEFNKDILDSAGNLSIFQRSGRNVEGTALHLGDTLKELRDAAFDYTTNLSLGITQQDHKAMVNTLTQEGVSLGRIEDEASLAGKSVRDLATQFTVTGVAYSRAFGVGLAEVGQFQAEMMTEMGKSVDETQRAFALMARGATESGIASNKFFAAMRAMSPDLGLFNLRLEDSVAVLTKISKVMSPRNAQKFMQESVAGLKSMGRQEKLRMSMLAGSGKTKGIVERDIERKTKNLIGRLTKDPAQAKALRAAFEDQGYAGIKSSIDKLGPEVSGALAESAIDLDLQKKQASKGQYGTAMATADLGIGGALEMQQSALTFLSKGKFKTIADALGSMDLEQVAESLGKSDEQVKQLAKLEVAIDAQRAALIEQGKVASEVNAMGYDEIINSMSDDMQKSLKVDEDGVSMDQKMEALAREQGQMTQSIVDKFQVLMDWLMNQFYGLMVDIWDAVMAITKPFSAEDRVTKRAVFESGNKDMINALKGSGGDMNVFKGNLLQGGSGFSQSMMGQLGRAYKPDASNQDLNATRRVMDTIDENIGTDADKIIAAASAVIKDQKKLDQIRAAAEGGANLTASLNAGGVSGQERQDIYGQASWQLSPMQLTNLGLLIDSFKKVTASPAGAGAAAGPTTPAKTTAVAAKSTNEHLQNVADDSRKQQAVLTQQGIKIAPATIKEEAKGMESAMLSALRTALFEYYMYSGTDRSVLASAMKVGGADPRGMSQYFTGKSLETGGTGAALAGITAGEAKPNAAGGLVTGIANGMAMVAAHGEGLASVGRGERIVPAGGSGDSGGVHVNVNGIGGQDLARLIHGKVVEGIREYKRRERLY